MRFTNERHARSLLTVLVLIALLSAATPDAHAQQKPGTSADDVVRVNTDLVQTAITVVDKNGHFVDGLDRGQFELLVDGKRRGISFFEQVTAGSAREAELTARPDANPAEVKPPISGATVRGRTIVFFIDDLHLAPDSLNRTREMLRHFLVNEMSSRDSVAIASASGQIGFLQQFTNNREVLSAAIERLAPRPYDVRGYGTGSTKMKEFDALMIDTSKSNNTVLNYYIGECMAQTNLPKRIPAAMAALALSCETQVRNSARVILTQAGAITQNTYLALASLMSSSARAPGRKLAFFISDGFLMDAGPRASDLRAKLDEIIDGARRAGVVVYSIDARGLFTNGIDITQGRARMDFGAPVGEIEATQDALNALAIDTGGRALRNQNYFDRWVDKVLDETSNYYLLAWRPDKETEKTHGFRSLKVSIAGQPELTARAPRGYLAGPQPAAAATETAKTPESHVSEKPESALRDALTDYYPNSSLPTVLSLTYLNTPKNETVLTSSIQIATSSLDYGADHKQLAAVRLAGVILTDQGKIAASFKNQLNVNPLTDKPSDGAGVIYNQHTPLAPGIYQVRVAARDDKSGRVGSAMQWIVIPDLSTHQLTLSSLLIGGQVLETPKSKETSAQVQLSVDHRFPRAGRLGFWLFVYNATRDSSGAPNLSVQTNVLRDGQIILTAPRRTVNNSAPDPDRIAFGQDIALQNLAPGKYDLRVTITDTLAGTSVMRSTDFEVR